MKKLMLKVSVVEALKPKDSEKVQGGGKSVWKDCTARPTLTEPTAIKVPQSVGGCYTWMTCG